MRTLLHQGHNLQKVPRAGAQQGLRISLRGKYHLLMPIMQTNLFLGRRKPEEHTGANPAGHRDIQLGPDKDRVREQVCLPPNTK